MSEGEEGRVWSLLGGVLCCRGREECMQQDEGFCHVPEQGVVPGVQCGTSAGVCSVGMSGVEGWCENLECRVMERGVADG